MQHARCTQGLWPAQYKANLAQKRSSPLDPNHSHFILVDNGTQKQFGTEIEFRGKFEKSASRIHSDTGIFAHEGLCFRASDNLSSI